MSEEELVSAFTKGQISRRVFVRQLMVRGLSVAAAVAYATSLAPAAAAAGNKQRYPGGYRTRNDHHPDHHSDPPFFPGSH